MEKISVITTMYKGKQYLETLLSTVEENRKQLQKKYPQMEIEYIIVNDDPQEKIEAIDNVVIINNEKNCGIHYSRAKGVKCSTGNYIQFLDQDDWLSKDALLKQYENIKDNDISLANGYEQKENENPPIYSSLKKQEEALNKKWYLAIGCMIISPGQCLIRKESIPQKWLTYYLDYNCSDDYLLWLMMFEENRKIVLNDEFVFYHNNTGNNISADFETCYRSNLLFCKLARKYQMLSEKTIKKIERMSNMKLSWKIEHKNKLVLIFKYFDVFWMNFLYKI